ncbi:MAG: DUF2878 domain-containing protein [Elusimicrobiota bacterium]|nr:MAG: DUF2878 domain-containing protein [Elusimicrobiota bacterium]
MRSSLVNWLGFQLGWFACVAGAGRGYFHLGVLVAGGLLTAHAAAAVAPRVEVGRILAVAAFGLALECAALSAGLHAYAGGFLPLWVAALWLLFAATVGSSMAWLAGRPWLAAALGAVAGPVSFRAGVGLNAGAYLGDPAQASALLAVLWAVALPGSFFVYRRIS